MSKASADVTFAAGLGDTVRIIVVRDNSVKVIP